MHMILDALGRAWLDCWRPKVLAWSVFPLVLMVVMAAVVGLLWWDSALQAMQHWLESARWLQWVWGWSGEGGSTLRAVVAAVLLVLLLSPLLIVLALGVVAVVMTPPMVELVAQQRFPYLQRKQGGSWMGSLWWAVRSTAMAVLALLLSMPLWWVPPLMVVLPALIGGWLSYRVMAFDALAEHATSAERQTILATHRHRLLLIGVVCGALGAVPGVVWASGLVFVAAFWILIPLAMWMYALILAFSSLWFAHYGLAALYGLRASVSEDDASAASCASRQA